MLIGAGCATVKARELVFLYESTVDTTMLDGSAPPLRVTFWLDSELPTGTGPIGPNPPSSTGYGPVNMLIRLGDETVVGTGGGITVFNNAGTTFVEDCFDVRPSAIAGSLYGRVVIFFRILLVDKDCDMLFSDTTLPTDPNFAIATDFQQVSINLGLSVNPDIREFTNTPAEELTPL